MPPTGHKVAQLIVGGALLPPRSSAARREHPPKPFNPQELARGKARARREFRPGASPPPLSSPLAPSSELNKPGLAWSDNAFQVTPPDSTGAIGPEDYVEFVNESVGVYDRSLGLVGSVVGLGSFVGVPEDDVFDPQIQWDPQSQRWLYLSDDIWEPSGANNNLLTFGWSRTASPTPAGSVGWCRYALYLGTEFDDYPKLGHYDGGLVFGANTYANNTNGAFQSARIWAVGKPEDGSTSCPRTLPVEEFGEVGGEARQNADGTQAFTPVPANTFDASGSAPVGYVVASEWPEEGSGIMIWHLTGDGTGGSPFSLVEDGVVPVASYSFPANAPQGSSSKVLDTLDTRLTQAVALSDPDASGSAEAVWTQHTVNGAEGRSAVRWYELIPSQCNASEGICAEAALRQGCPPPPSETCTAQISNPSDFVFNGAISPTSAGNAAVVHYNTSSSEQDPFIEAQSRTSTTPLSTMDAGETNLGESSDAAHDFSCNPGPCRWGDYAGATPDPVDNARVWGSNQLITASKGTVPHWITRNFALSP